MRRPIQTNPKSPPARGEQSKMISPDAARNVVGNVISFGLGALFGLVLYACYYRPTPKKEKSVKLKCD